LKRKDFQTLASVRLKEAKVLLGAGCHEGAYYLGGYAVECAFKAYIAKGTERHEFPDKERVNASYTHRLKDLARLAGLEEALHDAQKLHPELGRNWVIVRNWSEVSRYERPSQVEAENLIKAIEDRKHGVLRWLRRYW
jgi:HEPN domain-containing protein